MKNRLAFFALAIFLLLSASADALLWFPLDLPMRDGTNLATDFYIPGDNLVTPYPTLLIRTPYDKSLMAALGVSYAEAGIAVVIQDTRGRFASSGTDGVFMTDGWGEFKDGYDTCNWIALGGGWYNGRIVTWGASALGIIQYQLAGSAPPGLVGQIPLFSAPDLYEQVFYPGGVFRKEDITNWLEGQGSLFHLVNLLAHPTKDVYWQDADLANVAYRIGAAGYHMGGWFDLFSQGTIDGYLLYRHEAGLEHQYLVMGPWSHGSLGPVVNELTFPENCTQYWPQGEPDPSLEFLDAALFDELDSFNRPAVTYYVMGDVDDPGAPGNQWRTAEDWPPEEYEEIRLYPTVAGELAVDPEALTGLTYTYDPADPTPSYCGLSLTFNPGPCDVSDYGLRTDVLFFQTQVLPSPVEVTGRVTVDLEFSSSAEDTDFAAFLVDIYPDGRHILFLHGIKRASLRDDPGQAEALTPGLIDTLQIDLWSTSLIFNAGHRIGLYLASANYPMHEKNKNLFGQPIGSGQPALNTVYIGENTALILPVVGDYPWSPAGDDDDNDSADDDDYENDGDLDDDDDDDGCCG